VAKGQYNNIMNVVLQPVDEARGGWGRFIPGVKNAIKKAMSEKGA
jgi:hypothetical protein